MPRVLHYCRKAKSCLKMRVSIIQDIDDFCLSIKKYVLGQLSNNIEMNSIELKVQKQLQRMATMPTYVEDEMDNMEAIAIIETIPKESDNL